MRPISRVGNSGTKEIISIITFGQGNESISELTATLCHRNKVPEQIPSRGELQFGEAERLRIVTKLPSDNPLEP